MTTASRKTATAVALAFLSACGGAVSGGLGVLKFLDREYASVQTVALVEQRLAAVERTARTTNANVIKLLVHEGVQPVGDGP